MMEKIFIRLEQPKTQKKVALADDKQNLLNIIYQKNILILNFDGIMSNCKNKKYPATFSE